MLEAKLRMPMKHHAWATPYPPGCPSGIVLASAIWCSWAITRPWALSILITKACKSPPSQGAIVGTTKASVQCQLFGPSCAAMFEIREKVRLGCITGSSPSALPAEDIALRNRAPQPSEPGRVARSLRRQRQRPSHLLVPPASFFRRGASPSFRPPAPPQH